MHFIWAQTLITLLFVDLICVRTHENESNLHWYIFYRMLFICKYDSALFIQLYYISRRRNNWRCLLCDLLLLEYFLCYLNFSFVWMFKIQRILWEKKVSLPGNVDELWFDGIIAHRQDQVRDFFLFDVGWLLFRQTFKSLATLVLTCKTFFVIVRFNYMEFSKLSLCNKVKK